MKRIALILPLILLIAASFAYAQRGPMWQDDDLNLTDQQKQQMDDLRFQHQKVMIQKNAELKEAKLDLQNMMRNVNVDEKAVLAQQKKVSTLKGNIAEERLKQRLAMRKLLTKEQLEMLIKHERNRRGFGRSRGDGGGPRHMMRDREWKGSGDAPKSQRRSR